MFEAKQSANGKDQLKETQTVEHRLKMKDQLSDDDCDDTDHDQHDTDHDIDHDQQVVVESIETETSGSDCESDDDKKAHHQQAQASYHKQAQSPHHQQLKTPHHNQVQSPRHKQGQVLNRDYPPAQSTRHHQLKSPHHEQAQASYQRSNVFHNSNLDESDDEIIDEKAGCTDHPQQHSKSEVDNVPENNSDVLINPLNNSEKVKQDIRNTPKSEISGNSTSK